jgi:microsomal epoxide hydrolase
MEPAPFQIRVEQAVLDDLHTRLQRTRWTSVIKQADSQLAAGTPFLRELMHYWHTSYDWRQHEARLNALPQFMARIDGARVHFVHVKGRGAQPNPLLLLHGWPDSFYRFHKVLPILSGAAAGSSDASDSFDLVVPSLPGFAFTGPVKPVVREQPTRHSAQLIWKLMTDVLGYQRFAVAGGDGGSAIAQILAIDHPESVIGIHLTDLGWHASNVDPASVSKAEQKYLEAGQKHFMADNAYALVQMTRPHSLAVGLNDSPLGLASWIVDRFATWSDSDGDLAKSFSRDDLLTNIMLYWVTQTIGSSMFNYFADAQSPSLTAADHVDRPVGLALFPKDIGGIPPRAFAERTLNVQHWTEMPRGGHFAALEEPDLFARDVVDFLRALTT